MMAPNRSREAGLEVRPARSLLRLGQRAAGGKAVGLGLHDHALPLAGVQALAVVLGGGAKAVALAAVDAIAAAELFLRRGLLIGGAGRGTDRCNGEGEQGGGRGEAGAVLGSDHVGGSP